MAKKTKSKFNIGDLVAGAGAGGQLGGQSTGPTMTPPDLSGGAGAPPTAPSSTGMNDAMMTGTNRTKQYKAPGGKTHKSGLGGKKG